jgi:DNA-binding NarL/FixJ family response regulator
MTRGDIVLVVDDSPGTLGMLNDTLELAGYTVLVAQSALAALALVERVTPDIVLLDAVMPGMDGFEACRRLKRNQALASTPIVFMTGLTESEHVLRGLAAGGVDYVTKPVSPDEVVARLAVHLANARLTRSARAALDVSGRFLLAVNRSGEVLWCTPQAASLITAAGETTPVLPTAIRDWVRLGPLGSSQRQAAASATSDQVLEFSYVGETGPDELLLRLVAAASGPEGLLRQRLGLTPREAEVLFWVAQGKSNKDVADILSLSPRTVNKHLEQVFAKLGVENRASAAAMAARLLEQG